MSIDIIDKQKEVCEKFHSTFIPSEEDYKIGIASNVKTGLLPINGLRHPIENGTSGWYIWAGETFSDSPDSFEPLHIKHLSEYCPQIIKYLGLEPGFRFLISDNYEDVWRDQSLLVIDK